MRTMLKALAPRVLALAAFIGAASLATAQSPNGSSVPGPTVSFSWPAMQVNGTNASNYTLIVGTTNPPNPSSPFYSAFIFSSQGTSHTSSGVFTGTGPYYWRVFPNSNFNLGSSVWSFTVSGGGTVPGAPVIQWPPNGHCALPGQSIQFAWGAVSGATRYQFEITPNPATGSGTWTPSYTLTRTNIVYGPFTAANVGQTYTWRVAACNASGCGSFTTQTFCVNEGVPNIVLSPSSLDLLVESAVYNATFDVLNEGSANLLVSNITSNQAWATVGTTSFTVVPAGRTAVTVQLDGTSLAAGAHNAMLTIASNDPDENPLNLPTITFNAPGAGGGAQTDQKTFDIINSGQANLDVTNIVKSGADNAWLTFTVAGGNAPFTLAPNARRTVTVTGDASGKGIGAYCASIDVSSNDPDTPTASAMICLNVVEASGGGSNCDPHAADGNGDFSISAAEANNYYDAWLNYVHDDIDGVLFAFDASDGGGAYCCNSDGSHGLGSSCN